MRSWRSQRRSAQFQTAGYLFMLTAASYSRARAKVVKFENLAPHSAVGFVHKFVHLPCVIHLAY